MYNYYYIKTKSISENLVTSTIENYLRSFGIFSEENGMFFCQKPFLDISLMKIRNPESWSSLDYDSKETNYISIITSVFSEDNNYIKDILKDLENLTGLKIYPDD